MTKLLVELTAKELGMLEAESLSGIDGLVIDGASVEPADCAALPAELVALRGGDPERLAAWRDCDDIPVWIGEEGLEQTARLRDRWPEFLWMPLLQTYRPPVRYQMPIDHAGDGFKFYIPDTAAIHAYRVTDGDQQLEAVLARATELGFRSLWLHGYDAAEKGRGLDLEMLDRARAHFNGHLWLSGGISDDRHLANLAGEGGAQAAVVEAALLNRHSLDVLMAALAPSSRPVIPVSVEKKAVSQAVRAEDGLRQSG